MGKEHNAICALAERLDELLLERCDAARTLKEIDGEIDGAKRQLFALMKKTDTQSFTRGGTTFYIPAPRPAPATVGIRKSRGGKGGGADV